ncbi:DMT family transporter [Aneurinibacillus migulanus]|nr:DMT family transporter [Aneurinibacillus migulanus]MED0891581.1 DMT family transporter [Aneurinibacillus migulanus]MED1613730.1 DMT family transporter [Aneurinibacillus migulanus]GED12276.1 membrane protein [Aneurinibacillus migulanus]
MMNLINYVLLLIIGLIWGSQFFFVEWVVHTIPPVTLAASKALLGTVTLVIIQMFSSRREKKERREGYKKIWLSYFWIALLEAVSPFFLIGLGQQSINSSISAILIGTTPIFTIILVRFFVPDEKLNIKNLCSIIIGFIGLSILVGPEYTSASLQNNLLGDVAILGAALSFAASLILIKRLPPISSVLAMRNVLFIATVILIPLSLMFDAPWTIRLTLQQTIAVIVLGTVQAGIVYMLYYILINRTGATFASLTNYLVPLFGVILGTVFLNEDLKWNDSTALLLILISLGVNEIKGKKKKFDTNYS